MSISGTLSNALSGLVAAQRSAEVVSNNIANATTEGYGRRDVTLTSGALGGVHIGTVSRETDAGLISDRRLADADVGYASHQIAFYQALEQTVGIPGDAGSLSSAVSAFESALTTAASTPSSDIRLEETLNAAQSLTDTINRISDEIQGQRMTAESQIETEVARLNEALVRVSELNTQIRNMTTNGSDASALMDERQQHIDSISEVMPVRSYQRDNGQIALFTTTGAQLVDGTASQFGFESSGLIVPEMTFEGGALSGLTLNGQDIATQGPYAPIAGGSLQALFDTRDDWAISAQAELDAVALDLVERFENVATAIGAAGLFTDAGANYVAGNETGLAARISVNALVDPAQGGATWRLRDGLDAGTPGPVGDSTVLHAFVTALTTARSPSSGQFSSRAYTADDLAGALAAHIGSSRQSAEADQSFAAARQQSLVTAELSTGVDTDEELQKLMLIEQSYAANARVIQTADEMIETLLSM